MKSGRFAGTIEQSYRYSGHPGYHLSGMLDGALVKMSNGRKRFINGGDMGSFKYEGFVFGRTFVGQFAERTTKNKPLGGYFQLNR